MTDKREFSMQAKFWQVWPPSQQQLDQIDHVQLEMILQDLMTPEDEKDLDIAKEMLTQIGIQC
jgi:hypothetical protein